MFVVDSNYNK